IVDQPKAEVPSAREIDADFRVGDFMQILAVADPTGSAGEPERGLRRQEGQRLGANVPPEVQTEPSVDIEAKITPVATPPEDGQSAVDHRGGGDEASGVDVRPGREPIRGTLHLEVDRRP